MNINNIKEDIIDIVSSILKIGPNSVVGIDIGISSVRVAEIINPKSGVYKLNRFSYQRLPEGCLIEDDILKPTEIVKVIVDCMRESGIKNKMVCIGLSGPNTMSKRLQISSGTKEEIEDQVLWESEQYIPFGVDDSVVSFHIIGENEGGGLDVLVAAASNDLIGKFQNLIIEAGLKTKIIDLNLFALANLFEVALGDKVNSLNEGILVIDFGAQSTKLIIYKNKSIIFTREISIGGLVITEEIQRQMGLSFEEAEDLKIKGDNNGNLPEEILEIIEMSFDSFYMELKKTINFFLTASAEESLQLCFITGGTSLTVGLIEGLENALGMKVQIINPFEKITYNEKNISEESLAYISSCGCIAMGLALRKLRR